MKKAIGFSLAFFLFLIFSQEIFANPREKTATCASCAKAGKELKQLVATPSGSRGVIQRRRNQLVVFYAQRLIARLEASSKRLEKLISRIESRLSKIENVKPKTDISSIREEVNQAKEILAQLKIKIEDVKNKLLNLPNNETPKELFQEIRASIKEIKAGLNEVHQILVHLIGQIRGLKVGPKGTPAPVPTTIAE